MITFSLPGGPRAAAEARERLIACDGLLGSADGHVLLLLLTELVTNAVKHGGEPVEVAVIRSRERLTVAVTDPGAGFEWRGRPRTRPASAGGYGLLLVERMARRWGIEREEDSTTVWFELPHPRLGAKLRRGEATMSASE
jgi:anti-sigma regulatory factor (Ser/Thr protein kinase)